MERKILSSIEELNKKYREVLKKYGYVSFDQLEYGEEIYEHYKDQEGFEYTTTYRRNDKGVYIIHRGITTGEFCHVQYEIEKFQDTHKKAVVIYKLEGRYLVFYALENGKWKEVDRFPLPTEMSPAKGFLSRLHGIRNKYLVKTESRPKETNKAFFLSFF